MNFLRRPRPSTRRVPWLALGCLACLWTACGGPGSDGDDTGPPPPDTGASPCGADDDCDDGLFCNGAEACDPGAADADAEGCVAGPRPCSADQSCDEDARTCGDCANPDADGDGAEAPECGGDDCDDSDPGRFPGNTEVCDEANVDEDCDPTTFGTLDGDDDGYTSSACCNTDAAGALTCGNDCDDSEPGAHPTLAETCDSIDNDCDGMTDEGTVPTWYRDADGDGAGSAESGMQTGPCGDAPEGFVDNDTDCDDGDDQINPGATELCEATPVDNDCDGNANEGCDCTEGQQRNCPPPNQGVCAAGKEACSITGTWGSCSVSPSREECDGEDDDCDGMIDEIPTTGLPPLGLRTCYADPDLDGYPAASAAMITDCSCPAGYTLQAPVSGAIDCAPDNPVAHPGVTAFNTSPFCIDPDGTYCAAGIPRCVAGPSCTDTTPQLSPSSFDYDCNGTEEGQSGCSPCGAGCGCR